MNRPLEFSNATPNGRLIQTADGKRVARDIRSLGCPDALAASIEQRNAALDGKVASASNTELDEMNARLAAVAQQISVA
jgi:hypothetical protein